MIIPLHIYYSVLEKKAGKSSFAKGISNVFSSVKKVNTRPFLNRNLRKARPNMTPSDMASRVSKNWRKEYAALGRK